MNKESLNLWCIGLQLTFEILYLLFQSPFFNKFLDNWYRPGFSDIFFLLPWEFFWWKDWDKICVSFFLSLQKCEGTSLSMSFYSDFILILSWFYPDYILILSRCYPDFIQILSWFFKNSLYPNFIQILS